MKSPKAFIGLLCMQIVLGIGSTSGQIHQVQTEEIRKIIEVLPSGNQTVGWTQLNCAKSLFQLYTNQQFSPLWTDITSIKEGAAIISKANEDGLIPADYHADRINTLIARSSALSAYEKAELELALSDGLLLFCSHLLNGKVNPETVDSEWHVNPTEEDALKLFEQIKSGANIGAIVNSIRPTHKVYLSLKTSLQAYRKIQNSGGWPTLPEGVTLKKGMTDDRVIVLRKRLAASNDWKGGSNQESNVFDEEVFESVKYFQKRHGLFVDGEVGQGTLKALNVTVQERIDQIRVNMERWRWLPKKYSDYYIKVNIADYTLDVVKAGEVIKHHKVITGKTYRRTPVFSGKITYLVLNPTWTVPPGILTKDILPAVRKDATYLQKKNLTVLDASGKLLDPTQIDWTSPAVRGYTYRQPPGPDNALGAVKFMFPNKFSVYLHDTPSKELFEKTDRSFSSGCIRVQNPLELAELLLDNPDQWSKPKIDQVITSKLTTTVQLKTPPDIHILYWTSWADDLGMVQFRNDVYARDPALLQALNEQSKGL